MVGVEPGESGNSLAALGTMLIDYGVPVLPIIEDEQYVGLVTEQDLLRGLRSPQGELTPASSIMAPAPAVRNSAETSEVMRLLERTGLPGLAVVDHANRVVGVITASRIVATTDREARPKLVGGMATPFGVRLLGGGVIGGATNGHIFLTGAVMFITFMAANYVSLGLALLLPATIRATNWSGFVINSMSILLFLVFLRLQPLAGLHAAEHMVVHAIEQNEPLEPDVVARMPRVHPRCGTNLGVGLGLFLGISQTPWIPMADLRMLVALLATLFLFRPLGSFVQSAFTTKPPTSAQIELGIKAGKDLLRNYQSSGSLSPSIPVRLWQSGMLHAIAGSMIVATLFTALTSVLPIPDYWKVIL
jgi:hypothetical protein